MIKRARVIDNFDPEQRGRLLVEVSGEKFWVDYCSPAPGGSNISGSGMFFIPEKDSIVYVAPEESGKWVWLGNAFYSDTGDMSPPFESKTNSTEPLLKIIKAKNGSKLLFDDRPFDSNFNPPISFGLLSKNNYGLTVSENSGFLELKYKNNEIKFTDKGAYLKSSSLSLVFNSELNSIQLGNGKADILFSRNNIFLTTDGNIDINSNSFNIKSKNISIDNKGNPFSMKTGGFSIISTKDVNIAALNNYNETFDTKTEIGLKDSVEIVKNNKHVFSNNLILLECGLNFSKLLSESNRPSLSTFYLKIDGTIEAYNKIGGYKLLPIPEVGNAISTPGDYQNAVLGNNLVNFLNELFDTFINFINQTIANAPTDGICAVGNVSLSPSTIAIYTSLLTQLNIIKAKYISIPNPNAILSPSFKIK